MVKLCSGLNPTFLNLLSLYLATMRKSTSHELNCGVPQGSVLGPVIYVLCTSPIADMLRRHTVAFNPYPDDTQLYASFSCNDDLGLQRTLSNIEKCLNNVHL